MSDATRWPRVNKTRPCPVCGKTDACKISPDGTVGMCKRVEQGAFDTCTGGWYLHRLNGSAKNNGHAMPSGTSWRPTPKANGHAPKIHPTAEAAIAAAGKTIDGGTLNRTWTYHDHDGAEVARVARFDIAEGDKQFRPVHRAKSGWKIGDPCGLWPLYRLPELADGDPVHVLEGEKSADAAAALGLCATTSAHGSHAAEKTDWRPLAGRDVVILPDNDPDGAKYAADVARLLVQLDPPARVRVVKLPGLPARGDVVEFIEARRNDHPESIAAEIELLAVAAPPVDPVDIIGGPVLVCMADVQPREVQWLWQGRWPLGRITLIVGRPGEGKSFITTDAASRVTTGSPWPDGAPCPRGSVILISAEDDPSDTIRPRLDAHHADTRRVHLLTTVRRIVEGKPEDVSFTLADVRALEQTLRRVPDVKLIVIDPVGSFLGGATDAHRDNEVRAVLVPVARLAERYGAAVVIVAHRRKSTGDTADDLALGSRAFTGLARAVWHVSRDRKNPQRRLMLPGKNNLAPEGGGLAFTVYGDPVGVVQWEHDPVSMSADDALAADQEREGEDEDDCKLSRREHAKDWLQDRLADAAVPHKQVISDALEASISERTLDRAKRELRVVSKRSGTEWVWELPVSRVPKPQEEKAVAPLAPLAETLTFPEEKPQGCQGANSISPSDGGTLEGEGANAA